MSITSKRREVVRVSTACWKDGRDGIHITKRITPLKRKSFGFQVLADDANQVGVSDALKRILNLDECEDGVYEVVTCNESKDWETGCVEDWDYKLIPYNE